MGVLLLSATTKEKAEQMLNDYFYSTTYKITEDNTIVWKLGEIKTDLKLEIKNNRYKIYRL